MAGVGLDVGRIRAITLDLDDTLWPIWPTISRAEQALTAWLVRHAPAAGALASQPGVTRAMRLAVEAERPDLAHDLGALRLEALRALLRRAGEDVALAEAAFEVFLEERHRVDFFADAIDALELLSARYPVVALSNGNACVHRIGIGHRFCAAVSAREIGCGKPDRRIFLAGAAAAGVPPEAVLHVGDDAELDGRGALDAGMQLAWVNRTGLAWPDPTRRPHAVVTDLRQLCALLS
jgi:putative hydrolase of the HAD superfamily